MRKDEANKHEYCKHSRNSATGKAVHNRIVRRNVKIRVRKEQFS